MHGCLAVFQIANGSRGQVVRMKRKLQISAIQALFMIWVIQVLRRKHQNPPPFYCHKPPPHYLGHQSTRKSLTMRPLMSLIEVINHFLLFPYSQHHRYATFGGIMGKQLSFHGAAISAKNCRQLSSNTGSQKKKVTVGVVEGDIYCQFSQSFSIFLPCIMPIF